MIFNGLEFVPGSIIVKCKNEIREHAEVNNYLNSIKYFMLVPANVTSFFH